MWKKRKAIEGVSASSMVALKATLFEEEQRAKLQGKSQPAEKKTKVGSLPHPRLTIQVKSIKDTLGVSNKGLADRLARDEQLKPSSALTPEEMERRLREKAELYNRIKRGEVSVNDEDDERGYLVDFVRKGYLEQEQEDRERGSRHWDEQGPSYMQSEDTLRERERQAWERTVQQEAEAERKKRQGIELVEQIREQTLKGRAKAEEVRRRRQRLMQQRLERIKESIESKEAGGAPIDGKDAQRADEEEEEEDGSEESSVAEPYDPFDEGDDDDDKPAAK